MRVGIIHPDLGIGGAEQLIINLALSLQNKGHDVEIYTPYHDPKHCFKETINGTLKVFVRGNLFPNNIFGRCIALCAYIRMFLATLSVLFYSKKHDVIIVDQVSLGVPILKIFGRRVVFYCHFPDKLLCVKRESYLKKIYRFFIDYIQEICLMFANIILVNSLFTKRIFQQNFWLLNKLGFDPDVLYPAIESNLENRFTKQFFLSLNRYERKKNIGLSIEAYAIFKQKNPSSNLKLIIAGGYDPRVSENKEHHLELLELATKKGVDKDVIFGFSISDDERSYLLQFALAVLYTPENEHFGIVPVEAMYMKRPVIACKSGGPTESIIDGKSGFLLQTDPYQWAEKMEYIAKSKLIQEQIGKFGKEHVIKLFGMDAFADQADHYIKFDKKFK